MQEAPSSQNDPLSLSLETLYSWLNNSLEWLEQQVLEPARLAELAIIVASLLITYFLAGIMRKQIMRFEGQHNWLKVADQRYLYPALFGVTGLILLWTARLLAAPMIETQYILPIATSLLSAWVIIRVAASLIANREVARAVATTAWLLAALNIIGLLTPITQVLDQASLPVGSVDISLLDVLQGVFFTALLLWLAYSVSNIMERHVRTLYYMPANARELLIKTGRFILFALALLISLNASGIDLTALAVFSGALGVGIGFGLQKVVGNFISGVILLMDRSIKPGDVIETDQTYGVINHLGARFTSVITRDGTEYLIPNENLITQPVINWSHSDHNVRLRIPVQVAYNSDLHKVIERMNEAALKQPRILRKPEPRTLLRTFGESGIDLELRAWISDPENGVGNITSDIMLAMWEAFKLDGVEIPYPHRVIEFSKHHASHPSAQFTVPNTLPESEHGPEKPRPDAG